MATTEPAMADALEAVLRRCDPDKLQLKHVGSGCWTLSLVVGLNASDAHHVLEVIDTLNNAQPEIPDMFGAR